MKKIIFMRGVPGSGKTPWAIEMFGNDLKAVILSSADFFMKQGRYNWIAKLTPQSHAWNQNRFQTALEQGMETIIVDNTNIHAWEMHDYITMLENYPEYEFFQKVMDVDLETACNGTVHNVPAFAIIRMDEDFEVVDAMEHFNESNILTIG